MSVAPTEIAVTTDSVLVEQEPSRETRRRLRERKTGPDGLDSKDAEGGAALGDPTSMRSWLSCLDIVEEVFQYILSLTLVLQKEKNSWLLGKMFESGFPDASGREEG